MTKSPLDQSQSLTTQTTPKNSTTLTTTTNLTPAKSLGSNSQDVKAARLARVNDPSVKDPSIFKDPTDRQAATLARAQRIMSNPKFQALPQGDKDAVLKDYYNKHVTATYKDLGYAIPDESKWVGGIQNKTAKFSPDDYYNTSADSFLSHIQRTTATTIAGAADLFNHVSVAGINIGEKASKQFLNLDKFYADHDFHNAPFSTELAEHLKKDINKASSQVTDTMGFWLDTHPSKSWTSKADTFVGESLVQLPFYEAIGLPLKGAGALLKAGGEGSSFKPLANLTKTLTQTKGGQFVANRLKEGAEALTASVLQGQSKTDTAENMFAFMTIGSTLDGLGAGTSLIKGWTGKLLAMGGTPLQESVTQNAAHEMENMIVGYDRDHNAISIHPKTEDTGHIMVGDHKLEYNSKEEQQQLFHGVTRELNTNDPVRHEMNKAEKLTLSSLAKQQYGKAWNQLSKAQRRVIKAQRDKLTAETLRELPLHNADLAKQTAEASVKSDVKKNPKLAQKNAEFEKNFGVRVSDALHEAEMDYVAKDSGQDNVLSAAKKVDTTSREVNSERFKTRSEKIEEEPRRYASYKIDSLAYFKNVSKSYEKAKNKVDWAKDLEDMSDEDIIGELKDHAPGIKFEKDKDALLWSYNYRNNFPKPFRDKIENLLADRLPGNEQSWSKEAKNLENHMENLAYTGQLFSEGNIFRSTDTTGAASKWQRQHSREYQSQERKDYISSMKPYMNRHPEEVKQGLEVLKQLQTLRNDAIKHNEPNQVKLMSERIRNIVKTTKDDLEVKAGN